MKSILPFLIVVVVVACLGTFPTLYTRNKLKQDEVKEKVDTLKNQVPKAPEWALQQIDDEPACDILLTDRMKMLQAGYLYTISYTFETGLVMYKDDLIDFSEMSDNTVFTTDTCKMKNDLRGFIRKEIIKYFLSHPEIKLTKQ